MKRWRRPSGDEGATLILVLVFVMSFGLIVPALLTQAQTSVGSVAFTREVVEKSADAEAAADRAINLLRRGDFYNEPAQRCFHDPADVFGVNDSDVLTAEALVVAGQTKVRRTLTTCQAAPDSGYPTSVRVAINAANRPGQALLTLGRNSEKGLRQSANNTLRIQGRVFSNSTVEVENPNARLQVENSPIIARGDCIGPGSILAQPLSCNDSSQDALGVDPGYALPSTLPALAVAPPCTGPSRAFTLNPGRYTSAAALSNLTKSSCKALLHFTAGTYYFDFVDPSPVWTVTDGLVIGGSIPGGPRSWSPAAYPGTTPEVPGACVTPTESATNGGVSFIFGAASRMEISGGGKVELCGQYDVARPPIAVFGANAGSGSGPASTTVVATGTPSSTGNPKFESLDQAKVADGVTANATLVGAGSQGTASIELDLASAGVPAGAVLLDAKLKVAHRDVAGPPANIGSTSYPAGPVAQISATVTPKKPASSNPASPELMSANALVVGNDAAGDPVREDALDFTAAMKPYFDVYGFAGVKAKYTATVTPGASATAMLDGVRLDITYEVPGFRAQNTPGSCVGAFPYTNGSSGPCAFIKADGSNPETRLYVQGTTYAPLGALDITLNNVSEQVFRFGVIARAVKVAITGSSSFTGAVIAVPDDSPAYAATVPLAAHLQVYVCETGGSCPAPAAPVSGPYVPPAGSGWVRRLSSQVRVVDVAYPPTPGERKMDIVSWYHPR